MSWWQEIFTHFFAFQKKTSKCFRVPVTVQGFSTGWNMRKMQLHVHHGRKKRFRPATLAADSPQVETSQVMKETRFRFLGTAKNDLCITKSWPNHMESQNIMIFFGKHHVIFWRKRNKLISDKNKKNGETSCHFRAHVLIESLKQLLPKATLEKKGASRQLLLKRPGDATFDIMEPGKGSKPPIVVEHLI